VFLGGDVIEPLVVRGRAGERKQGTTRARLARRQVLRIAERLPMGELMHLLRSKAVLMPGVTVTLINEKTATPRPGNTRAACATT
jgi:topoisomerase-4 subunit B